MVRQDLILQTMKSKDLCPCEKTKVIGLMKDELCGKIMEGFVPLTPSTPTILQMKVMLTRKQIAQKSV